jgi:hypothetical protein
MNTTIWIVQIFLALAFAGSGLLILIQPYKKLAAQMAYVNDITPVSIRSNGPWNS